MKKTLVVNILSGPGAGKSTCAAGLFSSLKLEHISCELVTEYAKELVWRNHQTTLRNQLKVTAIQYDRLWTLRGKVDVILTDSPILLGLIYTSESTTSSFRPLVRELYDQFDNLNLFVERNYDLYAYETEGREQDREGASEKDRQLKALLASECIPYTSVQMAGIATIEEMLTIVKSKLMQV